MQVEKPLQSPAWKMFQANTLTWAVEVYLATIDVYIPPMLLQAGMEERYMTMVLAVGPVLGLIFIPMIGSASDSTRGRLGRRRPFIWMLSLGVLLGLLVMPHASHLSGLMSPQQPHWLEAALLVGAVCLLDFCGHACLTLLGALMSDLFPGEEENGRAFSVYSLMTSLGGCLGFLLPAVNWSQAPIVIYLGGQETFIFTLLTFLFLGCLLTTVFIPEETGTRAEERKTVISSPLEVGSSRFCPDSYLSWRQRFFVALARCASACTSVLPRVFATCVSVPAVIWRLFVAELCCWMALMSVFPFFADFMGKGLYQGEPNAEPQSEERKHYDEGVRMASLSLFLQYVVMTLCSVLMDRWVALLGAKLVYISGVALLVFASIIMSVSDSVITITVMVALTGYTLAVLHVLPYTLLCLYHSNTQDFFTSSKPGPPQLSGAEPSVGSSHVSLLKYELVAGDDGNDGGDGGEADCTPDSQRGMCFDIAVVENAYLLSQVLPSMFLGSIVQLTNNVSAYMASACCFSLLALLCSTRVVYRHSDLQR